MASCHPDRLHQAFGLCAQCYLKQYDAKRNRRKNPDDYDPRYRKPPHLPQRNADCHPDRPHWARGLCSVCYNQQRTNSIKADCHPDRPHLAKGLCASCYGQQRIRQEVPEQMRQERNQRHRAMARRLRDELVAAYGGRCSCPRCPETNPAFLTLEHLNGAGKAHRAKVGSHAYTDLRRRGWPKDGYTLLCWNCNAMTRFGRTCPHMED